MMVYSESAPHRANLVAAEATRQANADGTAATNKAADIAYYRTAFASAVANSCSTSSFVDALRSLGTGGS